jgi:putative transcriptional regulator
MDAQLYVGSLLIAHPALRDPNFKRSIVLIAEHSDNGTVGYVLNRRLEATLDDVLPDEFGSVDIDVPLFWGGPCQTDTLHCLHHLGTSIEGAIELCSGVYWGGKFDTIRELLVNHVAQPDDFRFFVGYAGWANGQLATELHEQSWLVAEGREQFVFYGNAKNLWTKAVRSLGVDYTLIANTPEHPSLN